MRFKLNHKKAVGGKFIANGLWFAVTAFFIFGLLINSATAATVEEYKGETLKFTEFLNYKQGEVVSYVFKIKNKGKKTWEKNKVFLESGPLLNSFSRVKHDSWLSFCRPVALDKDIKPGETAQLSIKIKVPVDVVGTIQENFQLVFNNKPIPGTLSRLFIDVAQSVAVKQGTAKINTLISQTSTNNQVVLPTANPYMTNVATTTKKVPDFCIALTQEKREEYAECQTNPNEDDQTNGVVKYKKILNSEPIIRIGLFNANSAQRVTCDKYFDVYAGNQILLSGLAPNSVVAVSFDFSVLQYGISTLNITKFGSQRIRIIPREKSGIITLIDLNNAPAWNKKLNDNLYRNIIEFRYSEKTKKLWVINELPINSYLKGLAETSNNSPLEFQKVMVTVARTYALYHYVRGLDNGLTNASTKHANEYFHLDATYDQVYKGYASELRMPKLAQAVNETSGLIVTYNNELAITPYFSNSDGRTRDWTEVWGGSAKSWLVSVAVPEDKGQTLWGHGVGMSARGALIMTRDENKTYQEALKYFYTGTVLQKMY